MDGQESSIFDVFSVLSRRQKIAAGAVLGVVLLMVLSAVLFQIIRPSKMESETNAAARHIDITNFDKYAAEMPEFYRNQIEALIYNTLVDYNGAAADTTAKAEIRDGSYEEESTGYENAYTSKFIVDIPSVKKSFVLDFGWTKGDNNPPDFDAEINCPSKEEWIYPGSSCMTSNEPMDVLAQYLPTELEVGGKKVSLSNEVYGDYSGARSGDSYLAVDIAGCEDSGTKDEVREAVKKWIEERMIDPAHVYIEYSFTHAICGS